MKPLLLLTHGAGAGHEHPIMAGWAQRLSTVARVVPITFPYRQQQKRRPDPMKKLVLFMDEQLKGVQEPVFLVGKSMGSRVNGLASANHPQVRGLICVGFPLLSGTKKSRAPELRSFSAPSLFLQGTRDRLTPLEPLKEALKPMSYPHKLYVVDTGDHSLQITKTYTKKTGVTQADSDQACLTEISAFLRRWSDQ